MQVWRGCPFKPKSLGPITERVTFGISRSGGGLRSGQGKHTGGMKKTNKNEVGEKEIEKRGKQK